MIEGRVKKAEKKKGESDRKTTKRETVGLTGVGLVEKRKERRDEKKKTKLANDRGTWKAAENEDKSQLSAHRATDEN